MVDHTKGNYAFLTTAKMWETEVAIRHGGKQPFPNVSNVAGNAAPKVAEFCQQWEHRVTRADVKIDIEGDFEEVCERLTAIANRQRIVPQLHYHRDLHGVDGDTLYIGSRKSQFQFCVYEKTKQLRTVKRMIVPDNIIRIEGRYRPPSKQAGIDAGKLKPVQYFAVSKLAREIYEEIAGEALDPIKVFRNGGGNREAALMAMLAQYGPHLKAVVEEQGGWDKMGEWLECLMPEAENLRAMWMDAQHQRQQAAS